MTKPKFQLGDVVRFRPLYVYDDEDDDVRYRAMVLGHHPDVSRVLLVITITPGAGEEVFGSTSALPEDMFEIDPDYTKGESK